MQNIILGIETSCDETAVAIFAADDGLLAHRVYSQVDLHAQYGGVVPEIASRAHVERILPVIEEAIGKAGITLEDLDAVAVATTP